MVDLNYMKNSILGRITDAIFQAFNPGYNKNKDIIIRDKDVVDRIIKCAEVFDIKGYKVKRIYATDLKLKDDNKLFIKMEFELQKDEAR